MFIFQVTNYPESIQALSHTWLLQGVFSKCFRACERKERGP